MKKYLLSILALITLLISCENSINTEETIKDEEEIEIQEDAILSSRKGSLVPQLEIVYLIKPSEKWFKETKNKNDIDFEEYNSKLISNYNLVKEKLDELGFDYYEVENEFNIFFKTDSKTIDLRVEHISNSGYKAVLINPGNDFELVNLAKIEKFDNIFNMIFDK